MKHNFKKKLAAFSSLFFLVVFFTGCIAAIPVIVYYYASDDGFVATADVKKNSDEVWQAMTRLAERRVSEGRAKILKKDDSNRLIKVTDDIQTAEAKVHPREGGGSRIIVKADVPDEKKEELEQKKEKELALRIMKALCEEAKADCKLVEH